MLISWNCVNDRQVELRRECLKSAKSLDRSKGAVGGQAPSKQICTKNRINRCISNSECADLYENSYKPANPPKNGQGMIIKKEHALSRIIYFWGSSNEIVYLPREYKKSNNRDNS